jgi:hypothetical protein
MTKDMVLANGMKLPEAWQAMDAGGQADWLAQLEDVQVRAQASVLVAAGRGSVRLMLLGWVALGLLPAERLGPVLATKALGEVRP